VLITDLRAAVAAGLEALCAPGAPLNMDAVGATWRRHAVGGTDPHVGRYLPSRLRTHRELIDAFLDVSTRIGVDGLAVVATAGPPAAGKSTQLTELGYDDTWRRIDPDDFKVLLIEHDLRSGNLAVPDEVADLALADCEGIMPMELSGIYHRESTVVADKVQQICMAARENVVIEGTMSWSGLAPQLVGDLATYGYQRLEVVLVEVPLTIALERSMARWWPDRQVGGMGGRFTPAAAIRSLYRTETETVCAAHARDLVEMATAASISAALKV